MSGKVMIEVETPVCIQCGKSSEIEVELNGYMAWKAGAYIQSALPNLAAPVREMLISGTHPACWEYLFGTEEDEDRLED